MRKRNLALWERIRQMMMERRRYTDIVLETELSKGTVATIMFQLRKEDSSLPEGVKSPRPYNELKPTKKPDVR